MAKYHKNLQRLIVMLIIISLLAPAMMATRPAAPRLSASLAEMIARDSTGMTRVIVQKANDTEQAERFVAARGGEMVKELGFINAFVAQLPTSSVTSLSQLAAVNWVSPDAQVVSANYLWNENPDYYRLRQQIAEHMFGTFKRQRAFTYTLMKG